MNVCLVRPATITTALAVGEDTAPPIGLAYLAAAIRQRDHQVQIVDALGEGLEDYHRVPELPTGLRHGLLDEQIVARVPPDTEVIGISAMFSLEWPFTRNLTKALRERFPRAIIVAGGEHITALPEYSMKDCQALDFCVLGEGEQTLVELLEVLQSGSDVSQVKGLYRRRGDAVEFTGQHARVRQVEGLPQPAWDLVPLHRYLDTGSMTGVNFGRSMPILASRGCPYQCTFCSSPNMWGTLWRIRSEDDVLSEMRTYMEAYNATNFDFYDLTAIVKREWIKSFCKKIIDSGIQITWQLPSGTRSEALDSEITELLFKSGCRYVNYAPESGSERTLAKIKKKIKKPIMLSSMRDGVKNQLNIKANIIFGFPHETYADFWQTLWFIARMALAGVSDLSAFPFSPYPGSELFNELRDGGRVVVDDRYFYSLSQYTDAQYVKSYCKRISNAGLRLLCLGAMALFYGISFLRRPARIVKLLREVLTMEPRTKLADALVRIRKKRGQLVIHDYPVERPFSGQGTLDATP